MIIQSRKVWIAGQFIPAQIVIQKGQIVRICPYNSFIADEDYENRRIVPGFIDIHTHGAYGVDTNDGDPDGLRRWMRCIPEEGVTSILPTTVTQMPDILKAALRNVSAVVREGYEGAEILGVHLEGPYLDMKYKGAQPEEAIVAPDVEQFMEYQEAAEGLIRCITLAPEHDREFELTRYCAENGVVVSIGHSSASYEQVLMGIANGASSMTHVFNGMSPVHHREPGMAGAALRIPDIFGEMICDGFHVHPAVMNTFYRTKGRDHAIMITDSLRAKYCLADQVLTLGGQEIVVGTDGLARIKGSETIAGSTLRMNQGLRILVEEAMVPFDMALNSCTINPARCLGVDFRKGKIGVGYDADLVVLEDNYEVNQTYCRGRKWK